MPIYEYRCSACGHQLETIQRFSDPPLVECPACSKPELKKLLSAAAFRLKGGGWYETDFKNGQQRNVAEGGKEAKAEAKTEGGDKAGCGAAVGCAGATDTAKSSQPTAGATGTPKAASNG